MIKIRVTILPYALDSILNLDGEALSHSPRPDEA